MAGQRESRLDAARSPNPARWLALRVGPLVVFAAIAGCRTLPCGLEPASVHAELQARVGPSINSPARPGEHLLGEEEAVALALWNNAAFQETLADLGLARADLIQAGLLPNPEMGWFFQVPDKPLKYVFDLPLEALWLRPIKLKAAGREAARTHDRLVQAGLDLIRDVRQAYADVILARERLVVAEEAVRLRQQISDVAEKRLRAGDASPQEAAAARVDALLARQDAVRAGYEVPLAEERLWNLMGVGRDDPMQIDGAEPALCQTLNVDELAQLAVGTRPDALAAVESTAAASERLRLARVGWVRLLGIADATSGKNTGHELGPALRFTLPIFNWNQGAIRRAEAELNKAMSAERTVHNQILLDVCRAHLQYEQACAELEASRRTVRPEVEAAIRRAQRAYQEGNTTYVIVLEATRQLLDSSLREAQLRAARRRAWADLERSVGQHLDSSRLPAPEAPPSGGRLP